MKYLTAVTALAVMLVTAAPASVSAADRRSTGPTATVCHVNRFTPGKKRPVKACFRSPGLKWTVR